MLYLLEFQTKVREDFTWYKYVDDIDVKLGRLLKDHNRQGSFKNLC